MPCLVCSTAECPLLCGSDATAGSEALNSKKEALKHMNSSTNCIWTESKQLDYVKYIKSERFTVLKYVPK